MFPNAVFVFRSLENGFPTEKYLEFQMYSLEKLLGIADELTGPLNHLIKFNLIHPKSMNDNENPCAYQNVECENKVMRAIQRSRKRSFGVRRIRLGSIYPDWLPPSLTDIDLSEQGIRTHIYTRRLPREATRVNMSTCGLTGELDLTALPRKLERLYLEANTLTGSVDLRSLPHSLKTLDLCQNHILEVIVDAKRLPESLEMVNISTQRVETKVCFQGGLS